MTGSKSSEKWVDIVSSQERQGSWYGQDLKDGRIACVKALIDGSASRDEKFKEMRMDSEIYDLPAPSLLELSLMNLFISSFTITRSTKA